MYDFYDCPENKGFVDEKYIQAKLESAGKTIMMLPSTGAWPAGYRSCLPEHVREFSDLIAAPKETAPVKIRASRQQMNELDEVQEWLIALSKYCRKRHMTYIARATVLAMLHSPRSGRRVFSFRKLAHQFGVSNHTVKSWYMQGVRIMQNNVNLMQADEHQKGHSLLESG